MIEAILGSILSALSTGLGALPILFVKNMSHKWRDILLAFTAGIMVAAASFSLIPEALSMSNFYVVAIGILLGTFILNQLEKNLPHIDLEHSKAKIVMDKKAILVVSAITLHNLPEGLSVGVSYATGEESFGALIAFAIGVQNAPEGLLVALFLVNQNISKLKAFLVATATGSIEIVASLIGLYLAGIVEGILPYGLAFAAGAMLFIVYKELIPESHGHGYERSSTYSFIIGLLTMVYLTQTF